MVGEYLPAELSLKSQNNETQPRSSSQRPSSAARRHAGRPSALALPGVPLSPGRGGQRPGPRLHLRPHRLLADFEEATERARSLRSTIQSVFDGADQRLVAMLLEPRQSRAVLAAAARHRQTGAEEQAVHIEILQQGEEKEPAASEVSGGVVLLDVVGMAGLK